MLPPPPGAGAPPRGKSWIRYCNVRTSLAGGNNIIMITPSKFSHKIFPNCLPISMCEKSELSQSWKRVAFSGVPAGLTLHVLHPSKTIHRVQDKYSFTSVSERVQLLPKVYLTFDLQNHFNKQTYLFGFNK